MPKNARVLQFSFDIVVPSYLDSYTLLDKLQNQIEKSHKDLNILGADITEDLTDTYRKLYNIPYDFQLELGDMLYDIYKAHKGEGLSDVDAYDLLYDDVTKRMNTDNDFAAIVPDDYIRKIGDCVYDEYDDYEW